MQYRDEEPERNGPATVAAAATAAAPRRVAVLVPLASQFGRGMLKGISAYAAAATPRWQLLLGLPSARALAALRVQRPDGILALAPTVAVVRRLARAGVPAVNCNGNAPGVPLTTVRTDNLAVGRLAADYFLARGYRHLAFCGRPRRPPLVERGRGFALRVGEAGATFHEFTRWPAVATTDIEERALLRRVKDLTRWLGRLPKPVAILASDDLVALHVTQCCALAGIDVPDEVAVLGVDNDDVLCQSVYPPLSSVSLPQQEIGHAAAAALDRLMRGPANVPHEPRERLFAPVEVVTRASTDSVAVHDECVGQALRFIRDHAAAPIGVGDVAEAAAVSRRVLEMRFRAALGRTVLREILRARVQRAAQLLRETDWPIERVARAAGFNGRERLSVTFRRLTGETPARYRRRFIRGPRPPAADDRRDLSAGRTTR